jgi:demethoxyubiquinone hydroxylase (CLK1/Coq7/Cat5 family)
VSEHKAQNEAKYDISIIRPQMRSEDFVMRSDGMDTARLQAIKKGLITLHTLELMAITIYRFQITAENCEFNRQLISAMCNEMTHYQDFQVKLYEYGFGPSIIRLAYWFVGFTLGFVSRLLGRSTILKTGVWVETKALNHYSELLETIEWDEDTRKIIEKNQADEFGHISRWKKMLQSEVGR